MSCNTNYYLYNLNYWNMISLTNSTMQSINWHQETNGSGAWMFIQVPLHVSLTRCSNLSHDLWISACSDDEYDNDKVIWCAVNMISFTNCTMLSINWHQDTSQAVMHSQKHQMWVPWPVARFYFTFDHNIHVLILIMNYKVICRVTRIFIYTIWTIGTWYYHSQIVRCNQLTGIKRRKQVVLVCSYKYHFTALWTVARIYHTICE